MEKCASHDDCFNRLYTKVDGMDDKLDRLFGELHKRLHDGDVKFVQIEMRLALCEETLAKSQTTKTDMKQKAISAIFDLVKLAVVALFGAAFWAVANGYNG
ncbi:MAG: hypothetical protein LUC93_06520 [Planctomycetaceae bacterium]|nr:hypothetical protein [Planctomycetaceae bacterium]